MYKIDCNSWKLSFVIPALNASATIVDVLNSIHRRRFTVEPEVIVVNHNSTDNTEALAEKCGAVVLNKVGGNVSAVRNTGVGHTSGELLIFLDADVVLTSAWYQEIGMVLAQMREQQRTVTGSHCSAPQNGHWIERYWFDNYVEEENAVSLGTGHMLVTRQFFLELNGFDENLVTGEDYDFCIRATKKGGRIVNNPKLSVVHYGYPQSLIGFIKREQWHGIGDVTSPKKILESKVALTALVFFVLHVLLVLSLFHAAYMSVLCLAAIFGLIFSCSYLKYSGSPFNVVLVNGAIYYFYFVGRVMSFRHVFSN